MSLYMVQFSYTSEAWAAFVRSPEDRRIVLTRILEQLGGRLIEFYYCFGEYDGLAIFEIPDDKAGMAAVLAAAAPGHLKETRTTLLLSVEDAMGAMDKVGELGYVAKTG